LKKGIDAIDVRGKRVLVRLDLDVPGDAEGRITDDRRIRAAQPTTRKLIEGGGRVVLLGHRGRPGANVGDGKKLSLEPVAKRLGELVGKPVRFIPECVGPAVKDVVASLRDSEICLLENLRFHEAEQIKDKKATADPALREKKDAFARQLAELGDVYVNDAFGTCHRDNASMLTVPLMMAGKPRVVGYHLQKELKFLGKAVAKPARPFVCILGGAKVSDKLGVIRSLLGKCDMVLIGGAMAYTFLAAERIEVGKSLTEPDLFGTARELRRQAGERLRLPQDSVTATAIEPGIPTQVFDHPTKSGGSVGLATATGSTGARGGGMVGNGATGSGIPTDRMGLDIGPKTVGMYRDVLTSAKTIVWNGPMGVFETPPFDQGTLAIAQAVAEATANGATSIIGGGDSAAAVEKAGLADKMSHISTGGGASLEFLEGKPFATLDALDDA